MAQSAPGMGKAAKERSCPAGREDGITAQEGGSEGWLLSGSSPTPETQLLHSTLSRQCPAHPRRCHRAESPFLLPTGPYSSAR